MKGRETIEHWERLICGEVMATTLHHDNSSSSNVGKSCHLYGSSDDTTNISQYNSCDAHCASNRLTIQQTVATRTVPQVLTRLTDRSRGTGDNRKGSSVFLPSRHHPGQVTQVKLDGGGEDVAGVQSWLHLPLGYPVALHLNAGPPRGLRDGLWGNTGRTMSTEESHIEELLSFFLIIHRSQLIQIWNQ